MTKQNAQFIPEEANQVAAEILTSHDPFGSEPLSHEFIRPLLAEAYAKGAQRKSERVTSIAEAASAPRNPFYQDSPADTVNYVNAALTVIGAAVQDIATDHPPENFAFGIHLMISGMQEALESHDFLVNSYREAGSDSRRTG